MSIYFVESSLDTIQTWKENRKKVQVPWCLPNALFILIFLMYLANFLHIFIQYDNFFSFQTYCLALRNEWQTNDCVKLREKETLLSVSSCKTYAYFPTKIARDHLSSYKRSLLPAAASIAYVMAVRVVEFPKGGYKIRKILPKNQQNQRKLLNFEFWINGEPSKSAKIWLSKSFFYVKNHPNFLNFFCNEED